MRRSLPLLLALPLLIAAPARAGHVTIGSNLKAAATHAESHATDSAYWNTKLAKGRVRSPAKGEVATVKLKGRVKVKGGAAPNVVMHIQVLRPIGGGKVRVMVTSGNLNLPLGGSADRVSAYTLQALPARICVHKGDYVALSTSGGYGANYPHGAAFQMFGSVGGSAFSSLFGAGRDMNGDAFAGTPHSGRELLMQVKIATHKSARPTCQ
jgi:hypothetical protein